MGTDVQSNEKRVLFVIPTVRDGEITRSLLASAGLREAGANKKRKKNETARRC
jgi:hypothetical protein